MTHHALGGAHWNAIKQSVDRLSLGGVVKQRGCAVGIDVIDFVLCNVRALNSPLHRLPRPDTGRIRLCDMKIIRRNSVTDDFCQNRCTTSLGAVEVFQRKECSAFSQYHSGTMSIKRPAFLRVDGLRESKPVKNRS